MKTTIYAAVIAIFSFACSGEGTSTASNETSTNDQNPSQTNEEKYYSAVISDYIELKNALVNTDASVAVVAAEKLAESLSEINMDMAATAARNISSTEDVEAQRADFKKVTDTLIPKLEQASLKNTVYVQYCPMAFDNTGASWLAVEKEINNPYFGDKMLRCGKIEKEL